MLLKSARNQLFQILVAHNLTPSDFSELNSQHAYLIEQKLTPFNFQISPLKGEHGIVAFPEVGTVKNYTDQLSQKWAEVLDYFDSWAAVLQEELSTPDLFAEFRSNAALFVSQSNAPDEKFNDTELRELGGQLRQIESGLSALGLPSNAQKALSNITQEAPDKASRFTKKEWQSWFIGAVVSQVTNLALSPEHVTAVYQLLKTTFTGILQLH